MNMDEYKILAEIYDILNPKEDIYLQRPFFEELVKKHSVLKILDCACGTGIHLSLFHEMGIECFGSDISGLGGIVEEGITLKYCSTHFLASFTSKSPITTTTALLGA